MNCAVFSILFIEGRDPLITYHFYDKAFYFEMINNLVIEEKDLPSNINSPGEVMAAFLHMENIESEENAEDLTGKCRILSYRSGLNYYDRTKGKVRNARKDLDG